MTKVPFLICITFFLVGMGIGLSLPSEYLLNSDGGFNSETDMKSLPARPYKDGFDEWVFIYKHNMKVCLILLLGLVTLGILTLLNLLWTGLALTVAARLAYLIGTSWQKTLALILPHGFFEII